MNITMMGHVIPINFHDVDIALPEIGPVLGFYDGGSNSISISKIEQESMEKSTVIHEILEAIAAMVELEIEHSVITTFENGLLQALTQNPELLTYLGGEELEKHIKGY